MLMKDRTSGLLLCLALTCLWAAGRLHAPLVRARAEQRLDAGEPLENAPPLVAFTTVALGGFRGLLADALWLRVSRLQDEGQYFELVQLADWITKLEPRTTEIWAFHAWNLAYNISVMMPEPEDRWRWVRHGIELLRDQGLVYNPGDPALYTELAWMFQYKIGAAADNAHLYYKRQWARAMIQLFDGPVPDFARLAAEPEALRRMREEYKLLPDVVRHVEQAYGPLDWRLPETHAIYWAYRGLRHADGNGYLPAERMICQCLAALFLNGRLVYQPDENLYRTEPNPDLLPRALTAYETTLARHPQEGIRTGYRNFLADAVRLLHDLGRAAEARQTFNRLHRESPTPETTAGLDAWLTSRLATDG